MNKTDLVSIRPPTAGDANFIMATWLRGLFYGNTWFGDIPKNIFMENYHRVIERLLSTPGTVVQIACLKEDPEVILGYSVTRKIDNESILDWVFVKSAWRKIGIAKSLVPKDLTTVTHLTKVGKSLKPNNVVYDPFR